MRTFIALVMLCAHCAYFLPSRAQAALPAASTCPVASPGFPDVSPLSPYAQAIDALAARGVICGYQDGTFGPDDHTLRAQMAALIARAMGWEAEDHGNSFPDQGPVDDALWRNVGTLAFYDVARGYPDGTYNPLGDVLYAQVISFITRALVVQGSWTAQGDDPTLYPNVPPDSGHRADIATYVHYAGAPPDVPLGQPFKQWDQPSSRAWFAAALWQALTNLPHAYKLYGVDLGLYTGAGEDPNLGTPLSEQQVRARMSSIAPYTNWVLTYYCDMGGVTTTGAIAHQLGLKIAMSASLGPDSAANAQELDCLIRAANNGEVDLAIVGVETLLSNALSESQLLADLSTVRQAVPARVPVATAEEFGQLLDHPAVIAAEDAVLVNIYPYWEGRSEDRAVAGLDADYQRVVAAAQNKQVIISETGWPSCGSTVGQAVPSPENESAYFLNAVSWARANNVAYFYFEALDEPWKAQYEGPAGPCWGLAERDGVWKPGVQQVFDGATVPDNWSGTANAVPRARQAVSRDQRRSATRAIPAWRWRR